LKTRHQSSPPVAALVVALILAAPAVARAQTQAPGPVPAPTGPAAVEVAPAPAPPVAPPPARIPLRLALELEAASGVITGSFHNQLLGLRLDGRFSEHVSLGGYLGLGDLKAKDGRARAGLVLAVLEYMVGEPSATVRYPLRFASGYLAANGPVARVAGGLAVAVGQRIDLVGELAGMVWLTNNQNLLSLDAALELAYRF